MKYLLIGYTGVAIPLDLLQRANEIRFLGQKWDDEAKRTVYWEKTALGDYNSGVIIDEREILSAEPEDKEAA